MIPISSIAAAKQISMLLYAMGEEAETVLASTSITNEERQVYNSDQYKFDSFFKEASNFIFKRASFNHRVQMNGETAEQLIVNLHHLAELCNYWRPYSISEIIRDRLVEMHNHHLSERLQLDSELTLEKDYLAT